MSVRHQAQLGAILARALPQSSLERTDHLEQPQVEAERPLAVDLWAGRWVGQWEPLSLLLQRWSLALTSSFLICLICSNDFGLLLLAVLPIHDHDHLRPEFSDVLSWKGQSLGPVVTTPDLSLTDRQAQNPALPSSLALLDRGSTELAVASLWVEAFFPVFPPLISTLRLGPVAASLP